MRSVTARERCAQRCRDEMREEEDALRNKKAVVIPLIVESFGGISGHSRHFIRRLADRARGPQARDGTVYGRSRTSVRSFYKHHTQQLARRRRRWVGGRPAG